MDEATWTQRLHAHLDTLSPCEGKKERTAECPLVGREAVARPAGEVIGSSIGRAATGPVLPVVIAATPAGVASAPAEPLAPIRAAPLGGSVLVRRPVVPVRDRVVLNQRLIAPRWQGLTSAPFLPVVPPPSLGAPVRAGDYLLWVDPAGGRAFFARALPRVLDFSLTITKEVQEGTIRITGGAAVIGLSAYEVVDAAGLVLLEQAWAATLGALGHGAPSWRFEPLSLRGLTASLDLNASFVTETPAPTVSSELGTATFLVKLSAVGAQAWKDALERGLPDAIAGVCALDAHYLVQLGGRIEVKDQTLSAPLGALLAGVGPEALHVVDPQISFDARVIVASHPTVQGTVVTWKPSEGHAAASLWFDETGGQFSALITTQNPEAVTIDWSAQVHFKPAAWPHVGLSGRLSVADDDWNLILKPGSMLTTVTISAVLLDENGEVIPDANFNDPATRVQAEIAFSANFLKGKKLKATLFEAENQHVVTVAFPNPPGEEPGSATLTIFAMRGEMVFAKKRKLTPDESLVAVMIWADAKIDIITSQDPVEELSVEGSVLGRLVALADATR